MAQVTNQPGALDITIQQGGTFNLILLWQDQNGNAINLTGYSADMRIKSAAGASTTLHESSTANGEITLSTNGTGSITILIAAATTAAFNWLSAVYDLKMTDGSGNIIYLVAGAAVLNAQVTQ